MSPPDDFVSSISFSVEITSSTFLGVTGRNEKELMVLYLPFIFFILGWILYLFCTNTFDRSDSFNDSDDSAHWSNTRDVMD